MVFARLQPAHGEQVLAGRQPQCFHQIASFGAGMKAVQVRGIPDHGDLVFREPVAVHEFPLGKFADGVNDLRTPSGVAHQELGPQAEKTRKELGKILKKNIVHSQRAGARQPGRRDVLAVQQIQTVPCGKPGQLAQKPLRRIGMRHVDQLYIRSF